MKLYFHKKIIEVNNKNLFYAIKISLKQLLSEEGIINFHHDFVINYSSYFHEILTRWKFIPYLLTIYIIFFVVIAAAGWLDDWLVLMLRNRVRSFRGFPQNCIFLNHKLSVYNLNVFHSEQRCGSVWWM
jgi:hypothetical protein